ncbi:hypothetical protein MJH12_05615, partial [bacterium]|nr:hypothetical protein [bacterium]
MNTYLIVLSDYILLSYNQFKNITRGTIGMKIFRNKVNILILGLGFSCSLHSEENSSSYHSWIGSLKQLFTIASHLPEDRFSSTSTVYIISKNDIENYNYLTISEALSHVPGFEISRSYLKHDIATSRGVLQNQYANKILFMIENIPTWHAI